MDRHYANTVRLLLSIAPDVFANDAFALKGGTAINLFVRDMPRLSVDLDVVYTPRQVPRDEALLEIAKHLTAIASKLRTRGFEVKAIAPKGFDDTKLLVSAGAELVKVEVNQVFRGTVMPVERRPLAASTGAMFSAELTLPILAADELYGSKLVAALDRQHPRDLFDVWQMYETDGLSDGAIECCVTYLAGHNRPTHEVLFPRLKDFTAEFDGGFAGMAVQTVGVDILTSARSRLLEELPRRLTGPQRRFLSGLSRAEPDWKLLKCPHAEQLPALRWKLANLEQFKKRRPDAFARQVAELESKLLL